MAASLAAVNSSRRNIDRLWSISSTAAHGLGRWSGSLPPAVGSSRRGAGRRAGRGDEGVGPGALAHVRERGPQAHAYPPVQRAAGPRTRPRPSDKSEGSADALVPRIGSADGTTSSARDAREAV